MDSKNQNTIRRLQEQIEIQKAQLEQEVGSCKQAVENVKVLSEELTASKKMQSLNEAAMEERTRFDMLLSEISTHFINLSSGRIDVEIEDAQRRVCECLDIDMCSIWQWVSENPDELVLTHLYRPLGGTPISERKHPKNFHGRPSS